MWQFIVLTNNFIYKKIKKIKEGTRRYYTKKKSREKEKKRKEKKATKKKKWKRKQQQCRGWGNQSTVATVPIEQTKLAL